MSESLFARLQAELLDRHAWWSRHQLRTAIFFWIEVTSNCQRRHFTRCMLTPEEWESRYVIRQAPQ